MRHFVCTEYYLQILYEVLFTRQHYKVYTVEISEQLQSILITCNYCNFVIINLKIGLSMYILIKEEL
jgi:hypothetical protein